MIKSLHGLLWFTAYFTCPETLSIHYTRPLQKFLKPAIAFWWQNERKIDSLISEKLVQKASDISACVMSYKEQMFPL